jgi:hypothetical protein
VTTKRMPHNSAFYGNATAQRPPGMRQLRTFTPSAAMYKYSAL